MASEAATAPIPSFKVDDTEVGNQRYAALAEFADYWTEKVSPQQRFSWMGSAKSESAPNIIRYTSPLPENAVKVLHNGFHHQNMLAQAVLTAYSNHLPLRLSPDAIWFTIAQGLARHVNENPEELRSKFVEFEGKHDLCVIVEPDFPDEDWPRVLPRFEALIAKNTRDDVSDLVVANFSTSTEISKMCSRVTLMDAMQNYFTYSVFTRCGIPQISLSGSADDWRSVRERAGALDKYDLEWWTKSLLPVLDELVHAAEGKPNRTFFRKMVNRHVIGRGSGSHVRYSGWFQELFPYIKRDEETHIRNPYLGMWTGFTNKFKKAIDLSVMQEDIPSGLSSAPFTFDKRPSGGSVYDMKFVGGLSCITQDRSTGEVEPQFGMAVVEVKKLKD